MLRLLNLTLGQNTFDSYLFNQPICLAAGTKGIHSQLGCDIDILHAYIRSNEIMDILIAPKECQKLLKVVLPRPKDEKPQHYLYDEDQLTLHEIMQYKDEYRSWFLDNQLCSEGHYKLATRVDPLFIFIPQLIRYAKDQFRPLGDICQDFEQMIKDKKAKKENSNGGFLPKKPSPLDGPDMDPVFDRLDFALTPNIRWENVCDTKQIDDEMFVRFSETKTIDWYVAKHVRLMEALTHELGHSISKATIISYALDLLDEYVPESLSIKFKDSARKKQYNGIDHKDMKGGVQIGSNKISENKSRNVPSAISSAKRTAPITGKNKASSSAQPPAKGLLTAYFTKK